MYQNQSVPYHNGVAPPQTKGMGNVIVRLQDAMRHNESDGHTIAYKKYIYTKQDDNSSSRSDRNDLYTESPTSKQKG